MTQKDMITRVKALAEETISDATAELYLSLASDKIRARLYPYGNNESIPDKYHNLQCELANRLYLRRGAQGEKSHNENGINRVYGSVNDEDLLSEIMPYVKVM